MENLYAKMVELLEKNESFAVATIFDKTGSAPRTEGAKMIVRADGTIFGTNIGAETPEELAVSIVAELIKVRADRNVGKTEKPREAASCCRIEKV
jgi:xanthine dehydrogenase accessory factor